MTKYIEGYEIQVWDKENCIWFGSDELGNPIYDVDTGEIPRVYETRFEAERVMVSFEFQNRTVPYRVNYAAYKA